MDDRQTGNKEGGKKGLSTTQVIIIFGFVLIIAAVVIVYLLLKPAPEQAQAPSSTMAGVISEANVSDINQEMQEAVDEGYFRTHMNMSWSFPDGESASTDAVIGNSSGNVYPFYFEVILDSTGETVYTSGLIPVGSVLDELILDTDLAAGTYAAQVKHHMINDDGEEVDTNMNIAITLEVRA